MITRQNDEEPQRAFPLGVAADLQRSNQGEGKQTVSSGSLPAAADKSSASGTRKRKRKANKDQTKKDDGGESPKRRRSLWSNLLPEVIHKVLTFLPVKELGRISTLSKSLKHAWKYSKSLCFDKDFAKNLSMGEVTERIKMILEEHKGDDVKRFHLYFDPCTVESLVESWIKFVIRKRVEEIELDFTPGSYASKPYILKTSNFDASSADVATLRLLKATHVVMSTDDRLVKGFPFLSTLTLHHVRVTTAILCEFVLNCKNLHHLELVKCVGFQFLKVHASGLRWFKTLIVEDCKEIKTMGIDAPTLNTLSYKGNLCRVFLVGIFAELENVVLDFSPSRHVQMVQERDDIVLAISKAASFKMSSVLLEGLCPRMENNQFKEMAFRFENLKEFNLVTRGVSYLNPADIISFLLKCPIIETVTIDLGEYVMSPGQYWEAVDKPRFLTTCMKDILTIKSVSLRGFKFLKLEIILAMYFLCHAKNMETLELTTAKSCSTHKHEPTFLAQLLQSPAEISLFDLPGNRKVTFPKRPRPAEVDVRMMKMDFLRVYFGITETPAHTSSASRAAVP